MPNCETRPVAVDGGFGPPSGEDRVETVCANPPPAKTQQQTERLARTAPTVAPRHEPLRPRRVRTTRTAQKRAVYAALGEPSLILSVRRGTLSIGFVPSFPGYHHHVPANPAGQNGEIGPGAGGPPIERPLHERATYPGTDPRSPHPEVLLENAHSRLLSPDSSLPTPDSRLGSPGRRSSDAVFMSISRRRTFVYGSDRSASSGTSTNSESP